MQEQFTALSKRVTQIESQHRQQTVDVFPSVEEDTVDDCIDDSIAATQMEQNEFLNNDSVGLDETSLASSVPPLDGFVPPVADSQSENMQENRLDDVEIAAVKENNAVTDNTATTAASTSCFFDPEQTTTRRWSPSDAFPAFIEKNFRQRLTTEEVNEVIGEYSPPEMDAFVAPFLE
jgi:hypothetical protein